MTTEQDRIPISQLFTAYDALFTKASDAYFEQSGMVNRSAELDYGFFPLGSGVFTTDSEINIAYIPPGGILVIGNDFGTIKYVDGLKHKREENNKTVLNVLGLGIEPETAFFSNYYMGLRDDVHIKGVKNTQKVIAFVSEFEALCHHFFLQHLALKAPTSSEYDWVKK